VSPGRGSLRGSNHCSERNLNPRRKETLFYQKEKKNETIIGISRCSESINAVTVNETSARGGKRGKLSSKILFHVALRGTPRTLKTVDAIYNEAAGGVNNEPRNFGCWSLKNHFVPTITMLLIRATGEIH
jgi:hypothetical protein